MTYENEKCPVCNKKFNDADDVVVCPICGTPHHRQCYIDNKNCANESLHSQGFEWQPAAQAVKSPVIIPSEFTEQVQPVADVEKPAGHDDGHKMVFCPNCGKENPAEEPVCKFCGERLYNNGEKGVFSQPVILPDMSNQQFGTPVIQISPDDEIGGNKVSDTAEYIQLNANRYIPRMYRMEKTKRKASFNWASFLFSPYWFFFRKMHIVGFVMMLILLLTTGFCTTDRLQETAQNYETVAQQYYEGNATYEEMMAASKKVISMPEIIIMTCVEIGVKVFSGFYGNYFYKKKVEKDIKDIKKQATSSEEYRLLLFKRGGISGGMCALAVFGYYCAEQIVYMLISNV